jgi:hypothetical protein
MNEVRSGVPSRGVRLDDAITRYPEGDDILQARPRIVAEITRRRDAD